MVCSLLYVGAPYGQSCRRGGDADDAARSQLQQLRQGCSVTGSISAKGSSPATALARSCR